VGDIGCNSSEAHSRSKWREPGGSSAHAYVRECERLMGWPDDWTRWGIDPSGNRIEISNSQRYRMCGNGVVANEAEWIASRILSCRFENGEKANLGGNHEVRA
jgi:site-specific DNA-cytosine methylase